MKTVRKNVTLSLPETLLRRFRGYAASRNQSMGKLVAEPISRMIVDQETERSKAKKRFLDRIHNAPDLGTHGVINWTRDDLYER